MNVSSDVIEALGSLRAYKSILPPAADPGRILPSLVVTVVAGDDDLDLESDPGPFTRLIQLDAWAGSDTSANEYVEQGKAALLASTEFAVSAMQLAAGPQGFDDEAKLWRASWEIELQYFDA